MIIMFMDQVYIMLGHFYRLILCHSILVLPIKLPWLVLANSFECLNYQFYLEFLEINEYEMV